MKKNPRLVVTKSQRLDARFTVRALTGVMKKQIDHLLLDTDRYDKEPEDLCDPATSVHRSRLVRLLTDLEIVRKVALEGWESRREVKTKKPDTSRPANDTAKTSH